jgi:putative phosphoesterase
MKLMIASDIHGSAYYCQKLMEAYKQEKADKLLLLGDLLYHGPRNDLPKDYNPKEVIVMLNSIKNEILCVRGNCEAEVDQMVLEFPVMADYIMLYVEGLTIFATHGHLYHENNLPPLKRGDILLHGHTHVSGIRNLGDITLVNPGSVSIPKENTKHSYMILEQGEFVLHNLD